MLITTRNKYIKHLHGNLETACPLCDAILGNATREGMYVEHHLQPATMLHHYWKIAHTFN